MLFSIPQFPRGIHLITPHINTHLPTLPTEGIFHLFLQHTSAGLTLNENVEMLYLHSEKYHPESDSGINPLDNLINIKWPLTLKAISKKDESLENFKNITPIKL